MYALSTGYQWIFRKNVLFLFHFLQLFHKNGELKNFFLSRCLFYKTKNHHRLSMNLLFLHFSFKLHFKFVLEKIFFFLKIYPLHSALLINLRNNIESSRHHQAKYIYFFLTLLLLFFFFSFLHFLDGMWVFLCRRIFDLKRAQMGSRQRGL